MRVLSSAAIAAMYDEETGDGPIVLLTIDHADLDAPILVSSDATTRIEENEQEIIYGTVSRGDSYIYMPFEMILPSDEDGGVPSVQLGIDNITNEITDAIRDLTGPPIALLEVVMMSDPDTVEIPWPELYLTDAEWTREQVQGTLTMETLLTEKMGRTYRPSTHPGMFK